MTNFPENQEGNEKLKDKIKRRNCQVADLKNRIKELKEENTSLRLDYQLLRERKINTA